MRIAERERRLDGDWGERPRMYGCVEAGEELKFESSVMMRFVAVWLGDFLEEEEVEERLVVLMFTSGCGGL